MGNNKRGITPKYAPSRREIVSHVVNTMCVFNLGPYLLLLEESSKRETTGQQLQQQHPEDRKVNPATWMTFEKPCPSTSDPRDYH